MISLLLRHRRFVPCEHRKRFMETFLFFQLLLLLLPVYGYFAIPKPPFQSLTSRKSAIHQQHRQQSLQLWAQNPKSRPSKKIPEFTVDETEDVDAEEFIAYDTAPEELVVIPDNTLESSNTADSLNRGDTNKVKVQYAAMEPGTVVQIEVGDMARARKAWKKRRRSDSPLLVPCSILHVDRFATLRWNCIYLLEKFGSTDRDGGGGIRISLSELSMRHRTHLKSSLLHHALSLGFADSHELLKGLFHKQVQDAYGVRLMSTSLEEDGNVSKDEEKDTVPPKIWLETPLSRARAQSRSAKAAMLQFCEPSETVDILQHTGYARVKRTSESANPSIGNNMYQLQPLSVALRVSSEDVDHVVSNGSRHAAVVFDYDVQGDAGLAPLLTLSLNPQRNQVRDRLKQKQKMLHFGAPNRLHKGNSDDMIRWFHDIKVGEGPYVGKVLRLIKGGALVDCGIRRQRRNQQNGDNDDDCIVKVDQSLPVYGFLRFKDAIRSNNDSTITDRVEGEEDLDEDNDEDWDTVFSIDDLNRFDDFDDDEEEEVGDYGDDDDDNLDQLDDLSTGNFMNPEDFEEDDEDEEEEENFDGEVLAEFNLENDDAFDEGEDITHLFELRDDGTLEYTDPETGVTQVVSDVIINERHDDDDEEDEFDLDDDIDDDEADGPVYLSPLDSGARTVQSSSLLPSSSGTQFRTQTLRVGDRIDVYVKSVSKQSSQLLLSMDSSIQGKKAKDLKKESEVSKKLSRLVKQLGGYKQIRALKGLVCQGVIQAFSNAGRGIWFYVQPEEMAAPTKLPVGIATLMETCIVPREELNVGDTVLIQIDGIDEDRGQLALSILDKVVS